MLCVYESIFLFPTTKVMVFLKKTQNFCVKMSYLLFYWNKISIFAPR